MISVRLSGRPSGHVQKLNVGLFSKTMVPSQIKLGMIITTVELYTATPLLVTFDLYLCHRVTTICAKYALSVSQQPHMSSQ